MRPQGVAQGCRDWPRCRLQLGSVQPDARSVLRWQVLAHLGEQLARAKWFGDIRVATGSAGLGLVSTQAHKMSPQ